MRNICLVAFVEILEFMKSAEIVKVGEVVDEQKNPIDPAHMSR